MRLHSIRTALIIVAMALAATAFGCAKKSSGAVSADLQGLANAQAQGGWHHDGDKRADEAAEADEGDGGEEHHHGDGDGDKGVDEAAGGGHHGGDGDRDKGTDEAGKRGDGDGDDAPGGGTGGAPAGNAGAPST